MPLIGRRAGRPSKSLFPHEEPAFFISTPFVHSNRIAIARRQKGIRFDFPGERKALATSDARMRATEDGSAIIR